MYALCVLGVSLRIRMSSSMRWRKGLTGRVGVSMACSCRRRGRLPHLPTWQACCRWKPRTSMLVTSGSAHPYRASGLVHWPLWTVVHNGPQRPFSRHLSELPRAFQVLTATHASCRLVPPRVPRHDPLHELIEERNGERGISMRGAPHHALADDLSSCGSKGRNLAAKDGGDIAGAVRSRP